ncbi:uncharacterized protein LOC132034698 [Lycium ferocissimum]|uniref:uncharacterized protein LOC132034698 n=1 Tax=Lycium ferocissimum TaxID=112874 RepID=UPI002814E974|nr:uncharacterized protein LOC132034698 [Lycium ferocissimum]
MEERDNVDWVVLRVSLADERLSRNLEGAKILDFDEFFIPVHPSPPAVATPDEEEVEFPDLAQPEVLSVLAGLDPKKKHVLVKGARARGRGDDHDMERLVTKRKKGNGDDGEGGGDASAEKEYAEIRSKKIHDPKRKASLQLRMSEITTSKRRNTSEVDSAKKGKNGSKFMLKRPPTAPVRIKAYMNQKIRDDLRDKLTDEQFEMFENTIFGKYLDMPVESEIQCQLFKCLMIRELKRSSKDAFVIDINGTELTFTLFDFALIIGIKCYDYTWGKEAFDDLIVSVHNRMQKILQFYCLRGFPYAMQVWIYECCSNVDPNLAVKTGNRIPRMLNWKTINTQPTVSLLMSRMFREGVSKDHINFRNIVPLTNEVEELGLRPFFVARPVSHTQIQETEDEYADFSTTTPHVAAAKEKERKDASKSPPRKKSRKMSTAPLPVENRQSTIQQTVIPPSVPTGVSVPVQPVQSKGKETVGTSTHRASVDDSSTNKSDDIKSLREDFNKFKQDFLDAFKFVFTELKDFRLAMDEKLTMLLENKKLNQNSEKDDGHEKQADNGNGSGDTVKVSTEEILEGGDLSGEQKISDECPAVETAKETVEEKKESDDSNDTEVIAQVLADIAKNDPKEQVTPQKNVGNTSFNDFVDPGAKVCDVQPIYEWLLPDEALPSQTPGKEIAKGEETEKGIILHPSVPRTIRPEKYHASPWCTEFGSNSGKQLMPLFDKKHPFHQFPITDVLDLDVFEEFCEWLNKGLLKRHDAKKNYEDHYRKNMAAFEDGVQYDFVVTTVKDKNWFYLLSMDGQLWNDEHIDVIFYYFRKKGKYDMNNNYTFTNVDCVFKQHFDVCYHAFHNVGTQTDVANEESTLIDYVKGHRLLANVPWHTVDNVLIPFNIKEENHWVLVVLSFLDRRLYVYNSYHSARHAAVVRTEVEKLATLLPHFLNMSGFFVNRRRLSLVKDTTSNDKGQMDTLDVVYVENLPQQEYGSM